MLVLKNNATIIELFKKCSEIHNNYKDEMDELESLESSLCDGVHSGVNDNIKNAQLEIREEKKEKVTLFSEATKVKKLVNKLESVQRKIIVELYFKGKTIKEVEAIVNCSRSTIIRKRDEGIRKFRELYIKSNQILLGYDLRE